MITIFKWTIHWFSLRYLPILEFLYNSLTQKYLLLRNNTTSMFTHFNQYLFFSILKTEPLVKSPLIYWLSQWVGIVKHILFTILNLSGKHSRPIIPRQSSTCHSLLLLYPRLRFEPRVRPPWFVSGLVHCDRWVRKSHRRQGITRDDVVCVIPGFWTWQGQQTFVTKLLMWYFV